MATKLSSNQIQEKLARLNTGWIIKDGKLHKQFVFDSFQEAFDWMGKVAKISEEIDHHPDWSNSYKKVTVDLITHCDHGITELDFMLAKKMEKIVNFKK